MDYKLMTEPHQPAAAPWAWPLEQRQVRTLPAAGLPRWLRVDEGCVWVTARRDEPPAEDLWLQAGDSLALPPGTAWIVEAWPRARLSLLQAAPAFSGAAPWRPAWQRWLSRLRAWVSSQPPQRLPRPGTCALRGLA